jgi:general stress protein 26
MDQHGDLQKLAKLIRGIRTAMLTTVEPDGCLRSRPMATQEMDPDGSLWFFTGASSRKVSETRRNHHVSITYQDTDDHQRYVSVSGSAELVFDKDKMRQLWNPAYKAWFPKGLDDPEIALLKVTIEKAEYWDSPASPVVYLVGMAKALATGKPMGSIGDHAKVELQRNAS